MKGTTHLRICLERRLLCERKSHRRTTERNLCLFLGPVMYTTVFFGSFIPHHPCLFFHVFAWSFNWHLLDYMTSYVLIAYYTSTHLVYP